MTSLKLFSKSRRVKYSCIFGFRTFLPSIDITYCYITVELCIFLVLQFHQVLEGKCHCLFFFFFRWALVFYFIDFNIFWLRRAACGILVPWPGIEPGPSAVRAWSHNHWTTRKLVTTGQSIVLFIFILESEFT